MKRIQSFLCASLVLCACSKNDTLPTAVDYSQYKLKTAVHSRRSYTATSSEFSSDTSSYTYNGTTLSYTTRYSTGRVSDNSITLSNGLYTQDLVVDGTPSPTKIYYRLNSIGCIDSSWLTNNSATTQTSKYHYNSDGTRAMEIHDYGTYKNRNSYTYQNGATTYSLNERISNSPSISNASDSVVYEYANELPFRVDYYSSGLPVSIFGKPAKSLLKKSTHYNKLNNNSVRDTREYVYQTDATGLITRKVFNLYTQPGNVMAFTDTTVYTYYNK
jgi:hypothetical protein